MNPGVASPMIFPTGDELVLLVELELRFACASRGPVGNQFDACLTSFIDQSVESTNLNVGHSEPSAAVNNMQVDGNSNFPTDSASPSSAFASPSPPCGERANKSGKRSNMSRDNWLRRYRGEA